ncbi:MAG: peptidyl-prolyl cis-trans isomerase [Thermodesulfobacteriota bacterium]
MNVRSLFLAAALLACGLALAEPGAAAGGSEAVAEVDGTPILRSHVEERIRELHRLRPRVRAEGEASAVDAAGIVQALVEERLMVREAERLGLDGAETVRRGLAEHVRDQAVLRLRRLEVLDKAEPSEEEVQTAFAARHGAGDGLGEGRERALERVRKDLLRQKIRDLSDAYVQDLAGRADVDVDRELLAGLEPGREESDGALVVARVDGVPITAREVRAEMDRSARSRQGMIQASHTPKDYAAWLDRVREAGLQAVITCVLVEAEARRRGLDRDPEVLAQAEGRRRELLIKTLLTDIIAPLAEPGEEEMRAYLAAHPGEFSRGCEYRFARMRFADETTARSAREEILQGAGFEYMAEKVYGQTVDAGDRVWVPEADLASAVRQDLASLKPGQVGEVVAEGRWFTLLKLKGRRGGETLPYDQARDALRRAVGRRNFDRVRAEYLERLRSAADITIHQAVVAGMEAEFWRPLPETGEPPAGEQ